LGEVEYNRTHHKSEAGHYAHTIVAAAKEAALPKQEPNFLNLGDNPHEKRTEDKTTTEGKERKFGRKVESAPRAKLQRSIDEACKT